MPELMFELLGVLNIDVALGFKLLTAILSMSLGCIDDDGAMF
jgi:hypothetical protein